MDFGRERANEGARAALRRNFCWKDSGQSRNVTARDQAWIEYPLDHSSHSYKHYELSSPAMVLSEAFLPQSFPAFCQLRSMLSPEFRFLAHNALTQRAVGKCPYKQGFVIADPSIEIAVELLRSP